MPPSSHHIQLVEKTGKEKRKRKDENKENKKHRKLSEDDNHINKYKDFARWIARSEHLFISWYSVLEVGLKLDSGDYEDETTFKKRFSIEIGIYRRLHAQFPRFANDMKKMNRKPKFEKEMFSLFNTAARGARSDDSNSLLSDGLDYVSALYGPLDPPIPAKRPKAEVRGFNHPLLARLLCPIDYIDSFDKDPAGFRAKLLNGSIKVHSTDFPLCLYDEELIDKDDPTAGFLRSKLFIAFFKHIFLGPSSALKEKLGGTKAKKGHGVRNGMTRVILGSLPYTATQLRWCYSASDDWRLEDGNWSPMEFFSAVMLALGIKVSKPLTDYHDDEEEEEEEEEVEDWVTDLLAFLNAEIFGIKSASETAAPARGSTLDKMLAKRKAVKEAKKSTDIASVARDIPAIEKPSVEGDESVTEPESGDEAGGIE